MRELATTYPNLVTVTSQGSSYEGRDMLMMKISSGGSGKNAIFVDGGRSDEWNKTKFGRSLIDLKEFTLVSGSHLPP